MATSLTLALIFAALPAGIVVESVDPGSAGEKAGFAAGDRIASWSQGADSGSIQTPFDLEYVEGERAPRGPVVLSVSRGEGSLSLSMGEEAWGIRGRPDLPQAALALLATARDAERGGQHTEAAQTFADIAAKTADPAVKAWFHVQSASASGAAARWEEAQLQYEAALADLDPRDAAAVWAKRATAYLAANSSSGVRKACEEARRLLESIGDEGLRYAMTLRSLTAVLMGDPSAAPIARRASSIAEVLAPDSLFLSRLWRAEAVVNFNDGDTERATALTQKAHALQKAKARGTPLEAATLLNLGVYSVQRGDLATAENSLRSATRILDEAGSKDRYHAAAWLNLGAVLAQRGDLDAAEDALQRSFDIGKDLPVLGSETPIALTNLGELAAERGDLERAEDLYTGAVSLLESVDAQWVGLAGPLNSLGRVTLSRGDLDRAEGFFRRARSLCQECKPGAEVLPGTTGGRLVLTTTTMGLADVARARGDVAAAEELYLEVAKAHSVWRPGSFEEADALGRIASLRVEAGRAAEAAVIYAGAIDALERQREQFGPGQERGSLRMADYALLYAQYVDVLLSLGQPEQAFRMVEASRARALLELLAQRDLGFARDIPPELDRERRRIKVSYDRVLAELGQSDAKADPEGMARLSARLRELQQDRLRIAAEIRQASPGLAEIDDPRPVSVAETRRALDSGTLFLSYIVGERKTVLFAVEPEGQARAAPAGLATFEIAAGRKELQERVAAFLALLQDRSAAPKEITAAAEGLYRLLIGPAEGMVCASSRILISPDGPLQTLPFAALAEPAVSGRRPRFLAERRPIHIVASATLYAELRQRRARRGATPDSIAAFGDPVYTVGQAAADEVALRSGVRGRSLGPLPGTGREVREIARLFPKHVMSFLGPDATEENAKSLPPGTRYVHFGCHALLNARSPLDSALVLSLPETPGEGRDNGILQAWEIFEDLRLDADIVTLSACESGLGAEVAGEGLVGLTRAFQYAGARSVLASLWSVSDDSTAELMALFYRKLKQGKPKDKALQEAQVAMIRRGYSPFHWAAFQLTGDWR